jgi:hypothetical protein
MKHQSVQDDFELGVGKRERIDRFVFEDDIEVCLSRLRAGPVYHLRRRVNSNRRGQVPTFSF